MIHIKRLLVGCVVFGVVFGATSLFPEIMTVLFISGSVVLGAYIVGYIFE